MQHNSYKTIIDQQQHYFASGATQPISFRIEQLKKLKSLITLHEEEISAALKKDLNKAPMEAVINEILFVIKEINFIIKHLKKWSRPVKTKTPFPLLWPGKSFIQFEPYGSVLIIGPWNYPFLLTMSPLIGAISAGNCVVLKPSEIATHTENLILKLINQHFPQEYIVAIHADANHMTQLLQEKFNYIFFTGGTQIGKVIMEAAAKQLIPVTLELGGKSPCIVDETADLDYAARRIIWAKMLNAGQTCIAPDYLLVHQSCKKMLIEKMQKILIQFFGEDPKTSESYSRIINARQFDRLSHLMQKGNIVAGGVTNRDELYIAPTLIDDVSLSDPIMQDEIFGPLLPIMTFNTIQDVVHIVKQRAKPLSLYLFTDNKENEKIILRDLSFGGGCINDCVLHLVNLNLPFGGVGQSGIGSYHGKYSFELFSHRKSVYKKSWLIDFKFTYPPYNLRKLNLVRMLFKI